MKHKTSAFRTRLTLAAAALASLLLAACSQDNADLPSGDTEGQPQITASISQGPDTDSGTPLTRASGTTWAPGDRIGITATTAGQTVATNIQYTTPAGDGAFTPVTTTGQNDGIRFSGKGQHTFTAYYPYKGNNGTLPGNGGIIKIITNNEEFAPEKQAEIDYLWGTATASSANPKANITFRHCMSRLLLHFVEGDGVTFPAGGLEFGLTMFSFSGQFDTRTGEAKATGSNDQVTNIPVPPSGTGSYILLPQDNPGLLLTVTINGREFSASLGDYLPNMASNPGKKGLEPGITYEFTITVKRKGLDVKAETGDVPWQDGVLTTTIDGKEFRLIRTAEDLARFARDVNGDGVTPGSAKSDLNALQVADIDLQDLAHSKDAALRALADDWEPIGSSVGNFSIQYGGIYCGNGYIVSGLRIKSNHGAGLNGLFGSVTGGGALLTGIHLRGVEITGTNYSKTGALAGYVSYGTVTLCSAQGKIDATLSSGGTYVGGLVGEADNSSINRCHTKMDITADAPLKSNGYAYAGGIVGWNSAQGGNNSTLFACRAEGSVSLTGTGTSTHAQPLCAGGIAGRNEYSSNSDSGGDARIYACLATGAVSIDKTGAGSLKAYAGGLVGYHGEYTELYYSYASGTATVMGGKDDGGTVSEGNAGAIVGGYASGGASCGIGSCFGAGVGGAGTSGLADNGSSIAYNTAPGSGKIWSIIASSWSISDIFTTIYDASATPAYGISVSERSFSGSGVWQSGAGGWPSLDMENNGDQL